MIHVGAIEDNNAMLQSLVGFINGQENMACTLQAKTIDDFFRQYQNSTPLDILLVDVELGNDVNSLDYIEKIKRTLQVNTKILVITGHNQPEYIGNALMKKADGYYLKGSGVDQLLNAITTVYQGGYFISTGATAHFPAILRSRHSEGKEFAIPLEARTLLSEYQLNNREIQIGILLTEGFSYQEISSKLFISINTVRHYVKSMYSKLNINNKMQLSKIFLPVFNERRTNLHF